MIDYLHQLGVRSEIVMVGNAFLIQTGYSWICMLLAGAVVGIAWMQGRQFVRSRDHRLFRELYAG